MLRRITSIERDEANRPRKRWYTSDAIDLYLWLSGDEEIVRFELYYDKPKAEKSFSWRKGGAVEHNEVDDGDVPGQYPASPIAVEPIAYDRHVASQIVNQIKGSLPKHHWEYIRDTLK